MPAAAGSGPPSVLLVGLGAVGALLGTALGPAPLTLALRPGAKGLARARQAGVRVLDEAGDVVRALQPGEARVVAGIEAVSNERFDFVIVATKLHDVTRLAPHLGALAERGAAVLFAQNGLPFFFTHGDGVSPELRGRTLASVDPSGELVRAVPVRQCLGCALFVCGELRHADDGPVVVHRALHGNARERVNIGAPVAEGAPRAAALVRLFQAGGLDAALLETPQALWTGVYNKLLGNCSFNFIAALTLCDMAILTTRGTELRALALSVMDEVRAVGLAAGLVGILSAEERVRMSETNHPVRPSTLQDVLHGRALELGIVNAVLELASMLHVATPRLDTLARLSMARNEAIVSASARN